MRDAISCSRRDFVRRSASGVVRLGLLTGAASWWSPTRSVAQERFPVVASEPWGRLERIAEGVWALVSNPSQDRATLCNGGIIAGRDGVVVVEAFGSDAGARWMAEQAMRLAGRAPTHVVLTHFHRDHTGGLRGATALGDPEILATSVTRDLVLARNENVPSAILDRVRALDTIRPTEIDLGDRSLLVVPRRGHTASDVTVEISDPSIVFCGDLVWNQMFPNYVDAIPSRLTQAVRLIRAGNHSTYVPGHGPLADGAAIDRYVGLLDDVEAKARRAIERGITPEQAAAQYRLPPMALGWTSFSDSYFATALGAWMRELGAP